MSAAAYAHCAEVLRREDRDAWLASLYAPEVARKHLHALQVFAREIAQVRDKVSAPLAGEIRLQWWRDALIGQGRGEVAGNPVAAALLATIGDCQLPKAPFDTMIEARIFDLYDDPMPDTPALEAYCGATHAALVRLATLALTQGAEPGGATAAGHAGMAIGMAAIFRDFPRCVARGQVYLPGDLLAAHGLTAGDVLARRSGDKLRAALFAFAASARDHLRLAEAGIASVALAARPAFLALAHVEPTLRAVERQRDPYAPVRDATPLMRQWRLWRYAKRRV